MILLHLLNAWDKLLGTMGIVAIAVIAFRLMVRTVKSGDALRSCLFLVCVLLLLSILPAMLVDSWLRMSIWQQFGMLSLSGFVGGFGLHRSASRRKRRGYER